MIRLFKFALRLVLGLAVTAVVLVLLRNVIAEAVLERQLRAASGLEVSIGRVRIGLMEPTLTLIDLRMFNPDDFGRDTCVDIPELHLEFDLEALRARTLHLRKVRLDLAELHVVRNEDGRNNFRELLARPALASSLAGGRPFEFQGIDTLNLGLGRFRYSDLQHPGQNDELFVGLKNRILHNVRSLDDVRPLLNRIALERDGKQFYDKCFSPRSNAAPAGAHSGGRPAATNPAAANPP